MVRNTYIYPPGALDADRLRHLRIHRRARCRSSTRSRSPATTCRRPGASLDLELAYTLADGIEYVRAGVAAGMAVDVFAPRLSFFWNAGMNYFMEVAKQRAARLLWAKLMREEFDAQGRPLAVAARPHPDQRLDAWRPRTCSTTSRAPRSRRWRRLGGQTQSLHTNSLDEAIALPTDFSARIARNTQLFLQTRAGIDPHHRPLGRQPTTSSA